jgi:hypothetical protein
MSRTAKLADLAAAYDSGGGFGFKNRIINPAMVIDQRNAGASVTASSVAAFIYTLDRWAYAASQASKFTIQQNAGSVTPPAGFQNYLGVTSSSAYSVTSSDYFLLQQPIEGFNVADLGFGAASASTVTVSFWIRSSLTGTFGGALQNSAQNRSYPFSYTISAANTWEQKSVTIAGDTTGTWLKTNGAGMTLVFSLGMGSSNSGTAGSWQASGVQSTTGATSVVGTNGATFYITGVQLEKGSTATSFDYRPYGTELALCQRYYFKTSGTATNSPFSLGQNYSTQNAIGYFKFPVTLRVAPSSMEQSGTAAQYQVSNSSASWIACSAVPTFNTSSNETASIVYTVASGISAGNASLQSAANTSAYLAWSAEL